jgi:flagellar FliJ protein
LKRFSFRLEKVLRLRKFKEEECKIALGQAISALNLIESNIKENAAKRHGAAAQRYDDPAQLVSWDMYILRLDQEAEKLLEQAAQAEIVVEEKRALYLEASQEYKALEKLKEKRMSEYKKEAEYADMSEIDEIVTTKMNEAISAG